MAGVATTRPPTADVADRARELLEANTQRAELRGKPYRFTVPSLRAYPFQWFWDSCFHAIAWSRFDWRRGADELAGLFAWQEPSGSIPHVVFWNPARVSAFAWHYLESRGPGSGIPFSRKPRHTAGIQPPVIAQAVERIVLAGGGDEYARETLPALERYYRYGGARSEPHGSGEEDSNKREPGQGEHNHEDPSKEPAVRHDNAILLWNCHWSC